MAYTVNHTDLANKGSITVEDNTLNQTTTLSLPGRNTTAYGTAIAENFLHLLENFTNSTAPGNPIEGQLWYDNTPGVDMLKLYDGTTWISASGLKKATTQPGAAQSVTGDLWVDTDNQQLYLYTGSGWVLVGPQFSDGLSTGVRATSIVGTNNVSYTCLIVEVSAKTLAIYSTATFTPKTTLTGFTSIKPGFNLSSADITGAGAGKYYGVAEKAEALVIAGETIPATNFIRNDATSQSLFPITVKNNGGITVGASSTLSVGVEGQAGLISHNTSGSNIDIRVNNNGVSQTVMRIDSTAKVGINNLSPDQPLDVVGNIQTDSQLLVDGTTDASTISTGSIITKGGVGIAKKLFVGSDTNLAGLTTTANIVPNTTTARNLGTANEQWLNVYSQNFIGNLTGNVTGTVSGRSGSTDKLASSTTFQMQGDVTAPSYTFDGQDASTKTFTTTISNAFVANKTEVSSSLSTDEFLINRVTGDTGVYKVSRTNLFKAIPTLPIGMISPYGGDTAPQGKDNMGGGSANVVTSAAADTMGSVEGQQNQTIAVTNLPEHEHDLRGPSGDQYYTIRDVSGTPNDAQGIQYDAPTGSQAGQAYPTSGGVLTNNALGSAVDIMNPYMALNYIMYAGENTAT